MNFNCITAALLATAATLASGKVFFEESFDNDNWEANWRVPSNNNNNLGSWEISSGKFFADAKVNRGLRTLNDMSFYALTAPLQTAASTQNGDFVVQFSAKNEQGLNCGGAYIKLLSGEVDVEKFSGQTPYKIMFGPDVCGATRRVHVILERDGQGRMIKKQIDFTNDSLTHMYTLILSQPSQTYRVLIDGAEVAAGSVLEDFEDMTAQPAQIPDPNAVKPANWVDEAQIPDPSDSKPEDWDENEEWNPRLMENPEYKGEWSAPLIANPDFKPDPTVAVYENLKHVGFDLWQVKAGTIFDNILVTDDFAEAQKALETLFTPFKDSEVEAERAFVEANPATESTDASDASEDVNPEDQQQQQQSEDVDQLESSNEEHTEL